MRAQVAAKVNQKEAESLLGQELPFNLEAEKALISSVLLDGSSIHAIAEKLSPLDFYHRAHRAIIEVFLELSKENKQVDLVVLHETLSNKKMLAECGGLDYLLELQEHVPCVSLLEQYIKIVKDRAVMRHLIISCSNTIRLCYNPQGNSVEKILDKAENEIFQLAGSAVSKNFFKLSELLKTTFEKLSKINEKKGDITGVPSGFHDFDSMTSGLQPGDLIILAARPSMGKTALALNAATNAWKAGHRIGIFSLEMSSEQLVLRMISAESGISHQKIRNANLSSEEWIELINTAAKMDIADIYIDDTPAISIMELRAKARRLKQKHQVDFLVVDYLQLITGDAKSENRTQEISGISRALKALAKELKVPILALSQLSRSLESRVDKRPILSDLRESGAIEQDGDLIMFIYRDIVYNKETPTPDLCELIVGKQRNGPTGTINLRFDGTLTRFENLEN
jgi:replicative DNA helicase